MKKILLFLSILGVFFTLNGVDVSARTITGTTTNTLEIRVASASVYASNDDVTVYKLFFTDPLGDTIAMEDFYNSMDYFGDNDYLFLLPQGYDDEWEYTKNGVTSNLNAPLMAIWFTFNTTEATSQMILIDEAGNLYGKDMLNVLDETSIFTSYKYNDVPATAYNEGYLDGYDEGNTIGYTTGYNEGYQEGLDDFYTNGSTYFGYNEGLSADFQNGVLDLYNNGVTVQGLSLSGLYDYSVIYELGDTAGYDRGFTNGTQANLDTSSIVFMNNFNTWIIPAILIVLLLGGAISVRNQKMRGD